MTQTESTETPGTAPRRRSDRSPWNWLLVPAIVIPLLVPFYNRVEPTLFGWPFFYWFQLASILIGVAATSIVFQKTKQSSADRAASRHSGRSRATEGEQRP